MAAPNPVMTHPMTLITIMIAGKSPQHNPMKETQQMHRVKDTANATIPVFCDTYVHE